MDDTANHAEMLIKFDRDEQMGTYGRNVSQRIYEYRKRTLSLAFLRI